MVFEYLASYSHVLVTGPQRSGTRIAAKMIAHDLEYVFVDEEQLSWDNEEIALEMIATSSGLVIQCPGLLDRVHEISNGTTAVVCMRRPIDQILRSQSRIGWSENENELRKYGWAGGVASIVKYGYWDMFLKKKVRHPFEVEYESLRFHPLWIDAELRKNFRSDQTTLEEESEFL